MIRSIIAGSLLGVILLTIVGCSVSVPPPPSGQIQTGAKITGGTEGGGAAAH